MITKKGTRMQLLRALPLLLLATWSSQSWAWQLHKDGDEVRIYQRETQQGLFEVKAVTEVQASLMSLVRLFDDTDAAPAWIDGCRKVEIIDWFGGNERLVHSYYASPWPLKDRDMVTFSKTSVSEDGKTLRIEISDRGMQHQLLPHYVRMRNIEGLWTIVQLENGHIRLTYQGSGDAGGSIPDWLSNRLKLSSTFKTFIQMRKFIQIEKYQ